MNGWSYRPRVVLGLLALLSLRSVDALDFGLLLGEKAQGGVASGAKPTFLNQLEVHAFGSWQDESWSFQVQGGLSHRATTTEGQLMVADLQRLGFRWLIPGLLGPSTSLLVGLGRDRYREPSGLILDGILDQVWLRAYLGPNSVEVGAGYTGLVNKRTSRLVYTLRDALDQGDDAVMFASPRLFAWITATWIPLPVLYLQGGYLRQQDLRQVVQPAYSPVQDGDATFDASRSAPFDTNYGLLRVTGALPGNVLGSIAAAFGQGSTMGYVMGDAYRTLPYLGWAWSASLAWKLDPFAVELTGGSASGDDVNRIVFEEGGVFYEKPQVVRGWKPAQVSPLGQILGLVPGNTAYAQLGWTHRLFKTAVGGLEYGLEVLTMFRLGQGPLSVPVNSDSLQPYLGTEVSARVEWRIFTDLALQAETAWFWPNTGGGGSFFGLRPSVEGVLSVGARMSL